MIPVCGYNAKLDEPGEDSLSAEQCPLEPKDSSRRKVLRGHQFESRATTPDACCESATTRRWVEGDSGSVAEIVSSRIRPQTYKRDSILICEVKVGIFQQLDRSQGILSIHDHVSRQRNRCALTS